MIGGKLMRGVETRIQEIRHRIFREVARMAYHTEWPVDKRIEELPYKIIPGEVGNFRNDVFLERAIVGERLRLAMGLPYRGASDPAPVSQGIEEADKPETYYTPPLINVIKFACNACPEKRVYVTDGCQGCLAHPCVEVCPKDAVSLDRTNGRSRIDPDRCIKCGQCANVCAYHAIIIQERPCAAACGMDAIHSDENGKADINYDKCVSCGQCLVNCPFGAIADKSQIFQVIRAIQTGERVYAAVAPAFVGQFGPKVTPGKLRAAMKALGFADVFEVAIGADLCAVQEAEDFVKEVPEQLPFMATSCCPAWVKHCETKYPELAENLSTCRSPQQMFGAVVREYYKDPEKNEGKRLVSVSIMPCTAKKEEILRPESMTNGKQDVDYVLTTTEIIRMIKKSGIVFDKVEIEAADVPFGIGSGSGVIFGVTGGVTEAVLRRLQQGHNRVDMEAIKTSGVRGDEGIKELTYNYNGREIKAAVVSGLANADKVIERIKNNEVHYDFVEVMACRRGCIMGGGQPVNAGPRTKRARMKGLYDTDVNTQIKKSNENPMILSLYDSLLKGKEHELLHRNFTK